MRTTTVIVIAILIVTGAGLFLGRYELTTGGPNVPARLDRWTGKVTLCTRDATVNDALVCR